ncbi:MAG: sel1 repeat family protein [Magnetococcales bacterium]|nr:sel1 repeat family protein [Magnetococcales bacterium]
MMSKMWMGTALLLLLVAGGIAFGLHQLSKSVNPPLHECDRQAAYWGNPHHGMVPDSLIHRDQAMAACQIALQDFPRTIRFQLQLARVMVLTGDIKRAAKMLRRIAEQGLAPAQLLYGSLFLSDNSGIPPDPLSAAAWFQKAAQQQFVAAYGPLAQLYHTGSGVAQKDEVAQPLWQQALPFYRQLAQKGDVASQFHLAQMYEQGQGVAADRAMALEWYRQAAAQGYQEAVAAVKRLSAQ